MLYMLQVNRIIFTEHFERTDCVEAMTVVMS